MTRIVFFAALPEEYTPLKRMVGPWSRRSSRPFRSFLRLLPGKELVLVETGMGPARIQEALEWIHGTIPADVIVSLGFAGSLNEEYDVGKVYFGQSFMRLRSSSGMVPGEEVILDPSEAILDFCNRHRVGRARVVTVDRPESKQFLKCTFGNGPVVLDMESHIVALFAMRECLPFFCLRGVSDGLEDVIDFDIHAITDARGHVRIHKVCRLLIKNPWLVRSFYASWRRSRRAAFQLGHVLAAFVMLPRENLHELMLSSRLRMGKIEEIGGF